jgi:Tfp pilus assembly protein PilX
MNLRFTIYDLRFTIEKKSPPPVIAGRRACAGTHRQSSIINHKSRQGFALVITLILLSVTLIMAVAFLAISRRERGSVVTTTDSATARYAADAALANAEAQIISAVLATTNPYINNLLVSTNYINASGFQTVPQLRLSQW